MELVIDPDVKAIAEFMQSSIPAVKLVSVASAIAALATILWSRHPSIAVDTLSLRYPMPSETLQPNAIEYALGTVRAGGDLVAEADPTSLR